MPIDRHPDDEFAPVAHAMKKLHRQQQAQPLGDFVARLENSLLPKLAQAAATRTSSNGVSGRIRSRFVTERVHHRTRASWAPIGAIIAAISIVSAFLLIATTARPDNRTTTAPAVAQSDTATPRSYEQAGIKWLALPPAGSDTELGGIALANGSVYRLVTSNSFSGVQALRSTDGSVLWETPTEWMPVVAADDKGVYFSMKDADGLMQLVSLDPANGQQRWTVLLPSGVNNIIAQADSIANLSDESFLQSGLVFVQDWTNQITAIDPTLGSIVWQESLGTTVPESETVVGTPVVSGNMIVAKSTRGTISGMYRTTGSVQWTLDGLSGAQFAAVNGVVVIVEQATQGPETSRVTGVELATGKTLWNVEYTGFLSQPIARDDGSNSSVAMVADTPDVTVIDAKRDGRTATPQAQGASSNPDLKGEVIVAIDPTSGLPKWTTQPIPDGVMSLFLRSPEHGLYTVVTREGNVALIQPTSNQDSSVQVNYAQVGEGSLMALDLTTGVVGQPVANVSGVFIGLRDGSILSLDDRGVLSVRG